MALISFWRSIPRPLRIILARLGTLVPQLFGVMFATFLLVRLLPGDPALLMLGNMATPEAIAALREKLHLNASIWSQFGAYLDALTHGDLGTSMFTSNPVTADLFQRVPATFELIVYSMLLTIVIGVGLAVVSVVRKGGVVDRMGKVYGLAAGAIPDFWVGLLLIYALFHMAGIAPAPFGRIDTFITPPPTITGFYTIDSILTGNWVALRSSVSHLFLPVLTLSIVNAGGLMKLSQSVFEDIYKSEFIRHARASGLSERRIILSALRNSLPPIITMVGFLFSFLLGAAVLVETIFAWGGLGQYAVQSVVNSDYPALQGFVLVAAGFILLVYTAVDVMYGLADPRIEI
ncbi:binding-protein-dependent transport system inner membrane protein [Caballeronia pedi]|uniref:Binding-protein-dependent transport system inner membrane protein n=1 Tax=Caballeronia pedi TaxID=1777141 RepID=A0A158CTM1_9BURK|nr:ABC transporter permease [Caballeronia pedi]SAK85550.1 binding-protein-dependent transport system inner membrane protein [Caballeronia pedi]